MLTQLDYIGNVYELTSQEAVRSYIEKGHGTVTLHNPKTNIYYTYKFTPVKEGKGPEWWAKAGVIFVKILAGKKEENGKKKKWLYIGLINPTHKKFCIQSQSSNYHAESPTIKGIDFIVEMMYTRPREKWGIMKIYHNVRCAKCGRPLTTPESIAEGLGPECGNRKVKAKKNAKDPGPSQMSFEFPKEDKKPTDINVYKDE